MSEPSISRPRRWDKPFSLEVGSEEELTDDMVDFLLTTLPFLKLIPLDLSDRYRCATL